MVEIELFYHSTVCKQMTELLVIHPNTWNHITLLTCSIELLEKKLFDHLTVCKQKMYLKKMTMCELETLYLC